jgi:hypothetical protein
MLKTLVVTAILSAGATAASRAQPAAPLTFHLLDASVAGVRCGTSATTGVFVLSTGGPQPLPFEVPDRQELLITDVHGWMQTGAPAAGGVTFEIRQEEPVDWPLRRNVLNGYARADSNGFEYFNVNVISGAAVPYVVIGNTHLHPSVCIILGYSGKPGDSGPTPQLDNVASVTVNGYLQPVP